MKKKLLVLVAMLLCVVTVLASCASSMKFEKIVGDGTYNDENPTLTTAAKVDVKGEYKYAEGDLALFEDVNAETGVSTYYVYNLATGAVVYTVADSEKTEGNVTTTVEHEFEFMTQWDTTWFMVFIETVTETVVEGEEPKEEEHYTVSLRDAKGAEFATATDIYDLDDGETVLDLIIYNEKAYRIADDGSIAYAFDYSALRSVPRVSSKVGDYYYAPIETYSNGPEPIVVGMQVYNSNLELVAYYEKPSYISSDAEAVYKPLNNGNVLIQYSVLENDMAEDYTYISDGDKYTLYTFILNVEKGTSKEISLDYVVEDVYARDARADYEMDYWKLYGMNQEIENLAEVYPIENERVNMSASAEKVAVMTNKGKINGMIDGLIDNMMPGAIFHVAPNRWVVLNHSYQMFLLNEKGEVLGEISNVDMEELMEAAFEGNGVKPYFILNDKIYDWDLAVKYDMHANKADVVLEMNHGVLMENEDDELLLYANGTVTTLIAKDVENKKWSPMLVGMEWNSDYGRNEPVFSTDGFMIRTEVEEGKYKYEFYNDLGAVVLTLENVVLDQNLYVCSADSTNAFMIKATTIPAEGEEAQTVYYRFG